MNRRNSLALVLLGTFCLDASARKAIAAGGKGETAPTPIYFGNG